MNIVATRRRGLTLAVVALCLSVIVVFCLIPKTGAENGPPAAPALNPITVTKTSVLVPAGDGNADPGETIEHTIVIGNGGTPATNVQLTDVLQSITTLSGSVAVSPIAVNDTYNAIGNVNISVPDGGLDLLANDTNPGGAGVLTITSAPATTTGGGNLSVNTTTGSFTYNPAPGFSGADTFTYTLGNGSGLTDTATVTINVSIPIWFVQAGAAGGGDGRLGTPFNCFVGAGCFSGTLLDEPGDTIFLYSGAYTGGQTLLNSQRILGAGAGVSLASFMGVTPESYSASLPATGGARPTITTVAAATNGLNLGSGNTLRGFNIGDTTGIDINGSAFGTLTISEMALSGTGRPLSLATGTAAITLDSISATSAPGGTGISLSAVGGTLTVSGTTSITGAGGQGISIAGSAVVANFGTSTTVATSATQGILVGTSTGNISFGNTSVSGGTDLISLQNNSAGTRSFGTVTTSNGTGDGFVHAVGGGTTTVSGLATITNPGGNCIDIQDSTTAVTFANVNCTLSGSTGVFLDDNTGAVTFADLDINPDSGQRGLEADPGITGTITTTSGTITTTTGIAVDIEGTGAATRTPLSMTLTSVTANGAANGIVLQNVNGPGASVGFVLNGDGANTTVGGNATGGIIANATGADGAVAGNAVYLNNADEVTLRRVTLNGTNQNHGVRGINVNAFTLEFSTVTGTNGNNEAFDEGGVNFDNLLGSAAVTSCLIEGGREDNLNVVNTSGTLNRLTISGTTFGFNSAVAGNNNILIESQNAGTVLNWTLKSSLIKGSHIDWLNASANSNSTMDAVIGGPLVADGNSFDNTGANAFVGPIPNGNRLVTGSIGNMTLDIRNNTLKGSLGEAIRVRSSAAGALTGLMNARVRNNTIGVAATANSGSTAGSGIFVFGDGGSDMNVAVTNNSIFQYNFHGISLQFGDETNNGGAYNATVTGNTINSPGTLLNNFNGIELNNGTIAATDDFTTCADIGGAGVGNNVTGSGKGAVPPNNAQIRLRQRQATTVRLPGYVGPARDNVDSDVAEVGTYLAGRNTGTTFVGNSVPGGGGFIGGAACTAPTVPAFAPDGSEEILQGDVAVSNFESILLDPVPDSPAREFEETYVPQREPTTTRDALAAMSRAWTALSTIAERLSETISPTAYAQDKKAAGPEGVGDVNVGPFGIPANESVTIKFSVTVNNGPYASGIDAITNTANVTADGGINMNSNTTSIPLDAAPDLQVTVSDGGTTTQPGVVVAYTTTYQNNTAVNGQDAAAVRITQTVPTNTTFNLAVSGGGWSCPDGSIGGTVCTFDVGAVNAGAPPAALNFAVNVLAALPAGAVQISDTATIAENPLNANGTDRVPANNTSNDTTNIIGNWDGSTSTAWAVNTNWSNDVTPPAGNNVSIPDVANAPLITTAVSLNNLVLNGENLTIDAPGVVTLSGNLTLGANIISGTGQINLGTASAINRTTGQINCTLQKNFAGPTPVGTPFVFPIGTTGAFSPLTVEVTNGAGQLTARANVPFQPALATISTRVLQRYWTLSGSGIRSNITFQYLDGDVPGAPNNENIWNVIRVTGTTIIRYPPGPNVALNAAANTFTVSNLETYSDWTAGEPLAPTAANAMVSGRVTDAEGRGVPGAVISMQDQSGNAIYAITNPFGYYRFASVATGQNYLIAPRHKRFTFEPRSISVNDDVVGVDFIPTP